MERKSEQPERPDMPERQEEGPERPQAREIPEIVHRQEPVRNNAMPPRPENEDNNKPFFGLKPIEEERERPDRPEEDIEPEEEKEKEQVSEKIEREEKPLKQMWPSFLQLLHRGLYMSAWKMQHKVFAYLCRLLTVSFHFATKTKSK